MFAEDDLAGVESLADFHYGGPGEEDGGLDPESTIYFDAIFAGESEQAVGIQGAVDGLGSAFADPVEIGGDGGIDVEEWEYRDGVGTPGGGDGRQQGEDGEAEEQFFRVTTRPVSFGRQRAGHRNAGALCGRQPCRSSRPVVPPWLRAPS